jgi:hypothetical protein
MTIFYEGLAAGRSGTVGSEETLTYLFRSDNHRDSTADILRHRKCPRIGSQHPNFYFLYVKNDGLSVSQGTGSEWTRWKVTAKFSALEKGEEKPEEQKDPEQTESDEPDWNPKMSVTFEDYQAPLTVSYITSTGAQITKERNAPPVASNMEPFDPPPEVFKQNATVRVVKNVSLRHRNLIQQAFNLRNTINEDSFRLWIGNLRGKRGVTLMTVSPEMCRIKIAIGDTQEYVDRRGRIRYYAELETQFCIKEETWAIELLDFGTYHLEPESAMDMKDRLRTGNFQLAFGQKKVPFKDAEENRIQGLLNGKGAKKESSAGNHFIKYDGYLTANHKDFFNKMTKRTGKPRG